MAIVMTIKIRGGKGLQSKINGLTDKTRDGIFMAFSNLAPEIKIDIQGELKRPKSGPIRTRYRPKRRVKVSLPGEAPATDTGLLVSSIDAEANRAQANLIISAGTKYAKFLELGTRRMLPRPFLVPALTRWRKRIIEELRIAIRNNL